MDLKGAVRDLRAQYGETQQRFADRLKISLRALANYEADREPTGRALYQLSRAAREIGRIDLADAFSDALAQELGLSPVVSFPAVATVANPIGLTRTPVDYVAPPPGLGADNAAIRAWLTETDRSVPLG